MGRKSVKADKSIYQVMREEQGLTREKASERMQTLSPERIEKLENGRVAVQPADVVELAEGYHHPELCSYYCANECMIGRGRVTEVHVKDLAQIAVETLNSLNRMNQEKDRLLEIVEDGVISKEESEDFLKIKKTLKRIASNVDSLELWIERMVAEEKLDPTTFSDAPPGGEV